MQPYTVFISDVHLNAELPRSTEIFLHWCATAARQAETIYILGDFFDAWMGNDVKTTHVLSIKQALSDLTAQGIKIYFIVGNHDFLIDSDFAHDTGITLLPDPSVVNIYGTQVLITHGDLMCTDDKLHLWFRRLGQNTALRKFSLSLPISWRQWLADRLLNNSQLHISEKNTYILDVNPQTVKQWLRQNQVTHMIHGHTHKPQRHLIELESPASQSKDSTIHQMQSAERWVLGCWYYQGEILHWSQNGKRWLEAVAQP